MDQIGFKICWKEPKKTNKQNLIKTKDQNHIFIITKLSLLLKLNERRS